MKKEAAAGGASMIFNVKFETAATPDEMRAVSVEVLAYGTAVKG